MGHSFSEEPKPTEVKCTREEMKPYDSASLDSAQQIKPQVHFNIWTCLGVNFSVTATPIAIGTFLALAIGVGGPPIFFYEYIFAGIGQLILCVAMAEVASAIPHSTGMTTLPIPEIFISTNEITMAL